MPGDVWNLGWPMLFLLFDSGPPPAHVPPTPAEQGWRAFTIAKPQDPSGPTSGSPLDGDPRFQPRLPATHDALRMTTGLGYVWHYDWAGELNASGRVSGIQTDFSAFVTAGRAGVEAPSLRLALLDPESGWGVEAGDMITELRGLARGLRTSWKGAGDRRPTVSLYLPSERLRDTTAVLAYRDDVRLSSRAIAGGEVATDGSYFVRTAYVRRRFDVQASHRRVRGNDRVMDAALMASMSIARDIGLQAGLRWFETPTDRGRSSLVALRVPVARLFAVTLETNRTEGRRSIDVTHAVGVQLLRGPVQLSQRYQWGDAEYLTVGGPFGIETRQLQTTGSYAPTRWATVGLQTATQWLADGRARQWQELTAAFTFRRSTSLQLFTSLPDLLDRSRFRSRLVQELPKEFSLLVDYGRVSAFQPMTVLDNRREPRLALMIRKRWRTPTPARGRDLSGQVLDEAGHPVVGAGVRFGQYLAFTDDDGRYRFPKVPRGEYALSLASESLPAHYASDGSSRLVSMSGTGADVMNLTAIPLNSIRGCVYHDVNRNGRCDPGEGRPGMAVRLGDRVTGTDAQGMYGFYNLQPDAYVVRLEVDRPGETYAAVSAAEIAVDLPPGRPVLGVDFSVAPRQKPVLFQEQAQRPQGEAQR